MKKSIKRAITFVCAFALVLILSSCSVFLKFDNSNASDWVSKTVNVTLNQQLIFADTGIYSGTPITNSVVFNADENTEDLSGIECAKKVRRSVVKIEITIDKASSLASGVIVDIEGGLGANEYYVLTCYHVVSSGGNITIYVPDDNARNDGDLDYDSDGYTFKGVIGTKNLPSGKEDVMLIGGDRETDVAVLKLSVGDRENRKGDPVSIEKAKVAPSTYQYQQGEEVFAIGNPSGNLPMTYLDGVISYEDRIVRLEPVGYLNLLQHNCLITHGSSGGGLFNMKGQLMGITNSGNDAYKGMNYAIPFSGEEGFIEIAKQLILTNTTKNFGYVQGRWVLGMTVKTAQTEINGSNVFIDLVVDYSSCYNLLQVGDYITNIKCVKKGYTTLDYAIQNEDELEEVIYLLREYVCVGDTIQFTVARRTAE